MTSARELQPYYSYFESGEWIGLDNPRWCYDGWAAAEVKGPSIRPMGGRCVVALDPLPDREGLIHFATDAMTTPYCTGVVLDAPKDVLLRRASLRSSSVTQDQLNASNFIKVDLEFKPGDRVYVLRFAGETLLAKTAHTLGHDRLRLTPCLEIMATVDGG